MKMTLSQEHKSKNALLIRDTADPASIYSERIQNVRLKINLTGIGEKRSIISSSKFLQNLFSHLAQKLKPFLMKILIIEKEEHLAKNISQYLIQARYICDTAHTIAEGKLLIDRSNYDCIILDNGAPGNNGLTFLKDLRKERNTAGIIVLSGKNTMEDTITSLKLGADDHLSKPIHLDELNARIEALIRRKYLYNNDSIGFRNLKLNTLSKTVMIDDKEISLTKSEYGILFLLLIKKGFVVTKEEIAVYLSGQSDVYFYNFDILYTHIKNLKKKLFPIGNCIRTIYGTGYKLLE